MDEWKNILDSGGTIEVCCMDFMKAFDKVPHKRLLAKIKSYGIEGNILKWIKEFLENRQQRVIVNGNYSEWSKVTSGIPQRSVLGPLLFDLYINDLPDCILSQVFLFVDDTKMFRHIQNSDDQIICQDYITRLQAWTDKWLLKFHPEKCKLLAIGKGRLVSSILCTQMISRQYPYLVFRPKRMLGLPSMKTWHSGMISPCVLLRQTISWASSGGPIRILTLSPSSYSSNPWWDLI